jgi:hypothetical protein
MIMNDLIIGLENIVNEQPNGRFKSNNKDNNYLMVAACDNNDLLRDELEHILCDCGHDYDLRDGPDPEYPTVQVYIWDDIEDDYMNSVDGRLDQIDTYLTDFEKRIIDIEKYLNDEVEISNDGIVKRNTVSKQDFDTNKVLNMRKELYDNLSNGTSIPDMRFMRLAACDILVTLKEIREMCKND